MSREDEILALADAVADAPTAADAARELAERGAWVAKPLHAESRFLVIDQDMLAALLRDLTTWPFAYSDGRERDPADG